MEAQFKPGLYIVATPIGNMGDITRRAEALLQRADVVYAEDTRVTKHLVNALGAKPVVYSYRELMELHRQESAAADVVARIQAGEVVAYCSDAGTPGVSDPGFALVTAVRAAGCLVVPIPGASALTALLSISGQPVERPLFMGFLPHKKGRQTALKGLATVLTEGFADAVVLFESPHRTCKVLEEIGTLLPTAHVVIGRELTKAFEEVIDAGWAEALALLQKRKEVKGEVVLLVHLKNW